MNVSRSRMFALALEEYLERRQNRELLARLNAACADEPDQGAQTLRRQSRRLHRRMLEGKGCRPG